MDEAGCQIHDVAQSMNRIKRYVPLIIIIGLFAFAWFLWGRHHLNLTALQAHQRMLLHFVNLHKMSSIVIYVGIYIAVVGLCLPVATFMTLAGGFLFGQLLGVCTVVIAATVGATLFFISVKRVSTDFFKRQSHKWVRKMQAGFQANAFSYLLTLRIVPLFPFVAINLVSALLQISLRTFFWGTLIGIMPGSFVYVSIGVALREGVQTSTLLTPDIFLSLTSLGILSLLPVLYKRW